MPVVGGVTRTVFCVRVGQHLHPQQHNHPASLRFEGARGHPEFVPLLILNSDLPMSCIVMLELQYLMDLFRFI